MTLRRSPIGANLENEVANRPCPLKPDEGDPVAEASGEESAPIRPARPRTGSASTASRAPCVIVSSAFEMEAIPSKTRSARGVAARVVAHEMTAN